jgi:hypothetical protein
VAGGAERRACQRAMSNTSTLGCVASLRTRLAAHWPVPVDDVSLLTIGLSCTLSNAPDVVDLVCSRALAPLVKRHRAALQLNPSEFTALLASVAGRGVATDVLQTTEFCERRKRVETALACTLAEANGARLWTRPATQIATVLAFHSQTQPFAALDAMFGSTIRADVRRAEDLHYAELCEPISVMTLTQLLETVARAALA